MIGYFIKQQEQMIYLIQWIGSHMHTKSAKLQNYAVIRFTHMCISV